jgi:sensor histidine kinase regulating citrate/malate metabolism
MFNRSRRLESQFDILMEVLDQGVIAVNEHGEIYAINKNAVEITLVSEKS